jgi:hypothetical protein
MQRHKALFARDAAGVERGARDRLDEPLWPSGPNARKLAELCVLTTLACERASRAQARGEDAAARREGDASSSTSPFDGAPGAALLEKVRRLSGVGIRNRAPSSSSSSSSRDADAADPVSALRELGLLALFPHMDGLARAGTKHQQHRARKSPGWDYFEHVAKMQQLVAVADGLKKRARHPANAKYVAHQIALLYQCVNAVRGELKPFKTTIEARFESVKQETETRPRLSEASAAWTERVAGDVAAAARAFPPQATEKLRACVVAAGGG